ncbi:hypothetical protein GQ53DRAFT_720376 [Thozetella sp. PMI_491]|nr:hypothetical protein GQ53DRAFT_720376 [Thozetella sp. PMI_491]
MASDGGSQDPGARGFRPLLSAPTDARRSPMQLSNLRPKNKSVRAACETCRKKKSKCTGERPQCQPCATRGTECHYETVATETHSQARKRKFDDLRSQNTVLQDLYNLLRTVSDEQSREILEKVRSGVEPETLVRVLQGSNSPVQLEAVPDGKLCYEFPYIPVMPEYLISPDNAYLRAQIYDTSALGPYASRVAPPGGKSVTEDESPLYQKPFHLATIVDERFENVTAQRWTTVISDNQLLANLLNAYFMHAYPAFPAFQKDLFLDDMVTGQTQFCSSLLVNAVLAHACHCYRPLSNRSNHWTSQSLAYRFVVEAKRLWDIEDHAGPKLTTIQAAIVLNVIYNSNGTDRIGTTLLQRAVVMADSMEIFTKPSQANSEEMARSRQFTAWCLFIWQVMHGYYFFKAPLIERPPAFALPDPDAGKDWYGEIWVRYSESNSLLRVNLPHLFKAWADLRVIINDISIVLFGERQVQGGAQGKLAANQVAYFRSALESWYQHLPGPMRPEQIALPFQIRLHMEYCSTLHALFQTQKNTGTPPPPSLPPSSRTFSVESLCSPAPDAEPSTASSIGGSTPFQAFPESPTSSLDAPAIKTEMRASTGSIGSVFNGYSSSPGPQLSFRLPPPPMLSANTGSPTSRFPHPPSTNYNQSNGAPSPTYSLPHRYPGTPGPAGTHGAIPAYSPPPSAAAAPGRFSMVHSPVYNAPLSSVAAPQPLPTPRPPVQAGRLSSVQTPIAPTTAAGQSNADAMAHSMNCCETLVRLYYHRHSFEYYDSFLIYFLTMLGTAAIERAAEARDMSTVEALRSTIALCIKGIYNQGENFYLATIVGRVLKNKIRADDLELLLRHGDLPEVDSDGEDIEADSVRAEWPIPIITINEDRRMSMIDNLVQTVRGFKISSQEGS